MAIGISSSYNEDWSGDTQNELDQARKEAEHWKKVASYLASCHAATAEYDGQLKSTSQARKNRFKSICTTAADLLEGKKLNSLSFSRTNIDEDIKRCRSAAKAE